MIIIRKYQNWSKQHTQNAEKNVKESDVEQEEKKRMLLGVVDNDFTKMLELIINKFIL